MSFSCFIPLVYVDIDMTTQFELLVGSRSTMQISERNNPRSLISEPTTTELLVVAQRNHTIYVCNWEIQILLTCQFVETFEELFWIVSDFQLNFQIHEWFTLAFKSKLSFNFTGSVCGGQCCDNKTETLLRKQSQRDFAALLRHNSRSLQGLLTSTATTLQSKF